MLVTRKTYTLVKRYYTLAVKKAEKKGIHIRDVPYFVFNYIFDHLISNPNVSYSDFVELCGTPNDYMYIRPLEHFIEAQTGGIIFEWKHEQEA